MTTVTWAWKFSNGVGQYWDDAVNWSDGALPGPGDEVVIPEKTVCEFGALKSDSADIVSLDVEGALGIDGGQMTMSGGLTVGANGGLEIDDPDVGSINSAIPAIVSIGGTLTNAAGIRFGSQATISIGELDNEATGHGRLGGHLTIGSVVNSGANLIAYNDNSNKGGTLTVAGDFTNSGDFNDGVFAGSGIGAETMTVKGTLDNSTSGAVFNVSDASLTVANVDNAGTHANGSKGGFGVNFISVEAGNTGGVLKVTGTFVNTGDVGVGNPDSTTSVTVATFDNKASGALDIAAGTVTVTTLDNAGASSASNKAGVGVDFKAGEAGGAKVTVTGKLTNTGDLGIGNSQMTSAATMIVDTLDNSGGGIFVAGGATSQAKLELDTTPTTWAGALGLSGDALVELNDNAAIDAIAEGGGIKITGNQAFVADADDTASSSALSGLRTIDGNLDLESGAAVTIDGDLTNNGLKVLDGGIAFDTAEDSKGSHLTVKGTLINNGDIGFGTNAEDSSGHVTLGAFDNNAAGSVGIFNTFVTVKGNLTNTASGIGLGIGVDTGENSSFSNVEVDGVLTNSGDFGIGHAEDGGSTTVTADSLDNEAAGSIGIINANLNVTDNLTNAGSGPNKGIGVGVDKSSFESDVSVGGELINTGDIGVGNGAEGKSKLIVGTDGNTSTAFDNGATGALGVSAATVTVNGDFINAGTGSTNGIQNGVGLDLASGTSGGVLKVTGTLTNSGAVGVGNAGDDGSTSVTLGALGNEDSGLFSIVDAAAAVQGDLTNSGGGDAGGTILLDAAAGAKGGSLSVTGKATNSAVIKIGNAGDDGSTIVTLGSLDNEDVGSIAIINAGITVKGALVNVGSSTSVGLIKVGDETGSTASSLTVGGALTNSGGLDVGDESVDRQEALVTAKTLTNMGFVDIGFSSKAAVAAVEVSGAYTQATGFHSVTNVQGLLSAATIDITGGTIDGTGDVVGAVDNTGGVIQAGANLTTPGALSIGGSSPGSYTQGGGGTLSELVTGTASGAFGLIKVNGAVTLAGALKILTGGGFAFKKGESFEVMSFAKGKLKGTFSSIVDGAHKASGDEVDIGGGLALKIVYDNAGGRIDLDVVAAPAAQREAGAYVYEPAGVHAAHADVSASLIGAPSPLAFAAALSGPSGDFASL